MQLRPYQEEARLAVEREWGEGRKRTLLVLPTGCGKTIVFSRIAADCVMRGMRVLILAHRGELLEQAADKLRAATGLRAQTEKAESTSVGKWCSVVVGSVQTLMRESRLKKFREDAFGAIIVDEAHHALSASYQNVLSYFGEAYVLGVTATPDRGDMKDMGEYFDSLAYEYSLAKAVKEGFLCPIKAQTIPLRLDISGVAIQNGDYKASDVGTALDPYLGQIAQEMAACCKGRKTVVFLPLVTTSRKFCRMLGETGLRAAEVNGESRDRAEILRDFDAGKYDILCNSMLLTEGWDCPSVDCITVLRPTRSRSLYCQMVGRGTRLSPGKSDLLILDFLWLTARHELCRPAHLLAKSREVADAMTARIEAAGEPEDIEDAEREASQDVIAQREESLAKQLAEMRGRKRKLVDPLQFEFSIQAEDLSGYVPSFGWEMGPASDKQKATLEKFGISPDGIECAGKAQQLITRLCKRRAEGLSTPKQIRFLEGRGFRHVGTWQMADASRLIDRIAANGWRIPPAIDPAAYVPEGTREDTI